MKIILNKEEKLIDDKTGIQDIIKGLGYRHAIVWVNEKQLNSKEVSTYLLKEGDAVKIFRMVAGG